MALTDFDYVKAQVPDYLHSLCHGVVKSMIYLYTDTSFSEMPWHLDRAKREILNERLANMKPPYEVTRTSRPLSEFAHWKASEFRSFALFYFSALEDLLPEKYFKHLLCLVYGMQVNLQEEVLVARVKETDILFRHFVREGEILFGEKYVSFNWHLTTHIPQSSLDWGCSWTNSTFIPEGVNGDVLAMVNGTQNAADQMARNFLLKKELRNESISLMSNYVLPKTVSELLGGLLNIHTIDSCIENQFKLLGPSQKTSTSLECEISIRNYFRSNDPTDSINSSLDSSLLKEHLSYERLQLSKKETFTTTSYTRSKKRINHCAFMKTEDFFLIENIVSFDCLPTNLPSVFIVGRIMGSFSKTKFSPDSLSGISFYNLPGQSTKLVGLSSHLVAFRPEDIVKKGVVGLNNVEFQTFVVTALPNSLESD